MKEKTHRQEVCKRVIHLMETRKNELLTIISEPDLNERNKEAVDFHVRGSSGTEYYLEHTLIESFPGQVNDGARIMDLLAPLESSLIGKLPPGHFSLSIASGAVAGATNKKKIQSSLERWVLEKAPSLSMQASAMQSYVRCREIPTSIPFEVVLSCEPRLKDGFYVYRFAPEELETKRRERIQVALDKKCPKLQDAKTQHHSHSVLILESNDIALANQGLIATAFAEEINKRSDDIPDEAYLVETDIPSQWLVWILKEGPNHFPDIIDYGPHYIDRKKTV